VRDVPPGRPDAPFQQDGEAVSLFAWGVGQFVGDIGDGLICDFDNSRSLQFGKEVLVEHALVALPWLPHNNLSFDIFANLPVASGKKLE
jgi:hypothetical protein